MQRQRLLARNPLKELPIALDLSSMQPADAAIALRSFPRRFRDAARAAVVDLGGDADDARVSELATRVGPDGYSAVDLVRAIADRLGDALEAIERGLVTDVTPVPAALLDDEPSIDHSESGGQLDEVILRFAGVAERLAEQVERADPHRWDSPLPVSGGGSTTPLALLRHAVAASVVAQRDLERTLRAVRGRPST